MSLAEHANWSMDGDTFKVLINDEGQHSIWPSAQPVPVGWQVIGPVGLKQVCLDWIKENWRDITPRSVNSQQHKNERSL